MQQFPNWAGLLLENPHEKIIHGDPYCEQELEGLKFRFSPQTFIQNHPEQSSNIYRRVRELAAQSRALADTRRRSTLENKRKLMEAKVAAMRAEFEEELRLLETDLETDSSNQRAADHITSAQAALRSVTA